LSCSPVGEISSTPAAAPSRLSEPSKYITQCSGRMVGVGSWFSRYSAMKSTSACDLMAVRGLKSIVRAPSSTAHLEILPVASWFRRMSPSG
jgi:hypothetical protein